MREEWSHFEYPTATSELKYKYRVVCDQNYFGSGCQDLCKPRDDRFGHYKCSQNGTIVCLEGWTGPYCDEGRCFKHMCVH